MRELNVWFSLVNKVKCPNCGTQTQGEVMGWYEYVNGKKRLILHFCDTCMIERVGQVIAAHCKKHNRNIVRFGYGGTYEKFKSLRSFFESQGLEVK